MQRNQEMSHCSAKAGSVGPGSKSVKIYETCTKLNFIGEL